MRIILIYPDDLGKETEDAIIEWMQMIIKSPSTITLPYYSPLKYVSDMEVDR